jgi:hypothetical protein
MRSPITITVSQTIFGIARIHGAAFDVRGIIRTGIAEVGAPIIITGLGVDANSGVADGVGAIDVLAVAVESCVRRACEEGDGDDEERGEVHNTC